MLKWFNKKKKDNKGFTLVELVIVVAILAILVGLLAPQYTKYVEKSRKTADATNMDEIVKVVKVFAADPVNDLPADTYVITMSNNSNTTTILKDDGGNVPAELTTELDNSIPKWNLSTTKSKKWGADGVAADIIAKITVNADGGTSVTYEPDAFENYMATGDAAVEAPTVAAP